MDAIYDFAEKAKAYYSEINKANSTDSMDVLVIRHKNGDLRSSPFYVKFGKSGVLKPKEKIVTIEVNGYLIDEIVMKLDECGEAFFVNKSLYESLHSSQDSIGNSIESNNESYQQKYEELKDETNNERPNSAYKVEAYFKAASVLKKVLSYNDNTTEFIPKFQTDKDECSLVTENSSSSNLKKSNSGPSISKKTSENQVGDTFYKCINLTSEMLKTFNLKPGQNEIKYTVLNSPSGIKSTKAFIFLWDSDDKFIVSDIDGTITKSDFRGHVMSFIGREWFHENIVDLFNSISENGYKIIYLSARPICQCEYTRNLLQSINQNDRYMPDGIVLVNPADFLSAFQSELIYKNPDEFKINCLNNIKLLFKDFQVNSDMSKNDNPCFAGFGNKPTDTSTYRKIGLDESSIFIINTYGQILGNPKVNELSYKILNDKVDEFFPKICKTQNK